jgi:dihydropteroate synthase
VIDVWADATSPWSKPIDAATEEERLKPLLDCMKKYSYPVVWSLDTTKSSIAEIGIAHGFTIINDVSWWRWDEDMIPLIVSHSNIKYVIMYAKNASWRADLLDSTYNNIIETIHQFLDERIAYLLNSGVQRSQIIIDPGMWAFVSTDYKDSLQILKNISELQKKYDLPVFVCTSRKWFHSKIIADDGPRDRIWSSLATSLYAVRQKVEYIRVHDVKYLTQAISILSQLE